MFAQRIRVVKKVMVHRSNFFVERFESTKHGAFFGYNKRPSNSLFFFPLASVSLLFLLAQESILIQALFFYSFVSLYIHFLYTIKNKKKNVTDTSNCFFFSVLLSFSLPLKRRSSELKCTRVWRGTSF